MIQRPSPHWRRRKDMVHARCRQLIESLPLSTPIPLRRVADMCNIKRVIFRPLLCDGGMGVVAGGYVIYVKCAREQVVNWTKSYENSEDRLLPHRARFTIAHEIVHTFFYDNLGSKPRNQVKDTDSNKFPLEALCNYGASLILMPEAYLGRSLKNQDILQPETIEIIRKQFDVSAEALVRRLYPLDNWGGMGAIVYIEETDSVYRVKALTADGSTSSYFPWKVGMDLSDHLWNDVVDSVKESNRGITVECGCWIPCRLGGEPHKQRGIFRVMRTRTTRAAYLLTFHSEGSPVAVMRTNARQARCERP